MTNRKAKVPNFPLIMSRIMIPEDANPEGNVHGGSILKLIAETAFVVSMRHCNGSSPDGFSRLPVVTVLARVEHTDFLYPVFLGEVCKIYAAVTFTSERSMEVTAEVWSENLETGSEHLTNRALFWYVAVPFGSALKGSKQLFVAMIPQLSLNETEQRKAEERYLLQKKDRQARGALLHAAHHGIVPITTVQHTPYSSCCTLIHVVLPYECLSSTGLLQGGPLMKLMDNCALTVATKHCGTNAVTACIDAINFVSPITKGEMVIVKGRLIFTSSRSMIILVTVEADSTKRDCLRMSNEAYFTFVSLDKSGKPLPVPSLIPQTEEDRKFYQLGKERYEEQKRQRKKAQGSSKL